MRSISIGLALCGAIAAHADILWDFKTTDTRPGNVNGIYAFYYPNTSDSSSHRTPAHTAQLGQVTSGAGSHNGSPGARLDFVLDGPKYPSAGFGLMFPESQPLDLRMMQSIRLHLSANKTRKVRLTLCSHDADYQNASDTGVALGIDVTVGPNGTELEIPALDLSWPPWTVDVPSMDPTDIRAKVFAIQLNVSCQSSGGTCSKDTGWVFLDSLRLIGVGGDWPTPAQGLGCHGDSTTVSRFQTSPAKKNALDGWWYAFTDHDAADSNSRGQSRILSAVDTTKPVSWVPDSVNNRAVMDFRLSRVGPYSGFVGLETQFGPPDLSGNPVPVTISDLSSISFDLAYGAFDPDLGGISFHAKKAGRAFQSGKEHQIRIPYDAAPKHWCIDFSSLQQPPWTSPLLAFTPTDLLSMSWEAKLQGSASVAHGNYSISNIKLYRNSNIGVRPATRLMKLTVRRLAGALSLDRDTRSGLATAILFDAAGHQLGRVDFAPNARTALIPAAPKGMAWIQYRDAQGAQTIPVGL